MGLWGLHQQIIWGHLDRLPAWQLAGRAIRVASVSTHRTTDGQRGQVRLKTLTNLPLYPAAFNSVNW